MTVAPVNDAPVAGLAPSFALAEDRTLVLSEAALSAGAMDVDGDVLSVSGVTLNGVGTLLNNGNGSYRYTPPANYHGEVSLQLHRE